MKTPRFLSSLLFAILAAVAARATIAPALQMQLGNPSGATANAANHSHYLIERPQYALDYNDTTRQPNWVSWDLTSGDVGGSGRSPDFFVDTSLPAGFYQVLTTDYSGSGYDRGHMCPSADRTITRADNDVTFLMSNMVPQAPDNNQGIWASFETYCRTVASAGNEVLITSGTSGFGGSTVASGVAIPGYTWKVVVVVPLGPGSAVDRIVAAGAAAIRVIAIKVPNIAGIRSTPWENFVTSAAQIQSDTGYTFFSALPGPTAGALVTKIDGQTATGAPVIVAQPTGQTAPVGATATFTVGVTGDAPLSYQWLKNDDEIAGATGATLTLNNVQAADVATYTVVATNAIGTVTSNAAALVVSGLPPTIVEEPTPRIASAGSSVSFTVTAGGSPPFAYQWRRNGVNLSDGGSLSGAATPTLTLANVQDADTASYDVVVTNGVSTVTSAGAALTVASAAPTITSQPANRSLAPGSTATFTVVAIGSTPLTYQWRKGGAPISGNASAATPTLTLAGISLADAGSYDVLVTNSFGFAPSSAASLTISNASATQIFYTGGTYAQDFDTLPATGTSLSFTGIPAATIVPLVNAPVNASGAGGWTFSKYAGTGTVPNFQVNAGGSATGGVFSYGTGTNPDRALGLLSSGGAISRFGATFVNNTGQTITQYTLSYIGEQWRRGNAAANVLAFSYGINPTDLNAGTFTNVAALNFTAPVVTGTLVALDGNAAANRVAVSSTVSGLAWGPGQTLVIRWTDVDDGGSDDGLAIDGLNLSTSVVGPMGPSVASTAPANGAAGIALNAGIAITFDQAVSATGPWFTVNSATRGALSASVTVSPDGRTHTLTPPSNFDFNETIAVTVLASNVTSQSTGLHPAANHSFAFVTAAAVAPSITTQPVSQTVVAGGNASFSVAAGGTAPFGYQWRKGGVPVAGNPTASSATLSLTNVQAADAGSYDVVVSNGVGSPALSGPATLTVTPAAPTITTQPLSQTVMAGETVTFTVAAVGTNPLAYQWRRNGVNLADGGNLGGTNTATLTLAPATVANSGSYDVVVSNGVGAPATSNAAALLVNPLPEPFTAGNLVVVRVGTGTGSLVSTGNPVYLDEYTTAGALVQSVSLPVAASGGNRPIVIGGTSTTEGGLSRSVDARFLTLGGYATAPGGSAGLSGTTASAVNRVVARVDANAGINTATVLNDWASGSSPRGVASIDGSAFWIAGGAGGVRLASVGATTSTSISTTIANLRLVDIFANQLYVSTQSGSAVRIGAVGTGVPATTGQVIAAVPGVSLTSAPNAFFFADLDAGVAGVDTLYASDEGAVTGGIVKYSLVGGTWVTNGTITAASVRGLTASVSDHKVTLFASTGGSAATGGGTLFTFTDTTGYNGAVAGAASVLATAAANTAFRGIAFAPGAAPTITASPESLTATVEDAVSFTVAANASGALTYQWRKGGVNLADGGSVAGSRSATLTLTGLTMADQGDYDCVVANPIGATPSDAATLTVNQAIATVTLGTLDFVYSGAPAETTATADRAGLTVLITYDGSPAAPVNAGSYAVVATVDDVNYTGTASGTLTIAKAAAGVTLVDLTQTYSGAPRTIGAVTSPAGLDVAFTYDGSPAAPTNAGGYSVVGTVVDANYTGSASGVLNVAKATALVTLGDLSQTYDGTPRAASATVNPAQAVTLTYNGSAAAPTNAGSYSVVAAVNTANYTGLASGTLNIAKATATVTLANLSRTYDGAPKPATVTTTPAGLTVVTTYNGLLAAPAATGSYAVVATINDANHAGSAAGTLVINPGAGAITLSRLVQAYDGTPKAVTVATTPADLPVTVTYNGNATPPTTPGSYAVVATISDANRTGSVSGTLTITVTALVRHAPSLNGGVDGSIQMLLAENAALNGSVIVSGDLLVPGTPTVRLNGRPVYGGTIEGAGSAASSAYTVTLNGNTVLRHVVRRTDAIAMPVVAAPPAPAGTRNVSLNNASQSPGNFATLRNLTLNGSGNSGNNDNNNNGGGNNNNGNGNNNDGNNGNGNNNGAGNAGALAVPAGTYGVFTVNGNNRLIFGVAGGTEPVVYNLQGLTLNGNSEVELVGPVIINVATGVSLNGAIGSAEHPEWLTLNIASGGLTLNGNAICDGVVVTPAGTVVLNGASTLNGRVICDRLTINGAALLNEVAP